VRGWAQRERQPHEPSLVVALGTGLLGERGLDVLDRRAGRGSELLERDRFAVRQEADRVRQKLPSPDLTDHRRGSLDVVLHQNWLILYIRID
jgi:hypothetical protein